MLRCGNGRQITLGEIRDMGLDAYALMGVDRNTKLLKRTTSNLAIKLDTSIDIVEEKEIAQVIEITPINKPSDRFDIEDYMQYREYILNNGGEPSISDYFKAIEYYMNGGK